MADAKITALPAATTPVAGTEVLPIVQSGTTKKLSINDLTAGKDVAANRFNAAIGLKAGGAAAGYVQIMYSGVADFEWNAGVGGSNVLRLYDNVAGNEKLRINGSTGDITNSKGSFVVGTAGKGIDFSANGGDVLSQYDEGTWTPTDASGAGLTLTVVTAKYTRIGRLVTVNCYVQYPVTADASAVRITLPFTATSYDIATAAAGTGAVFSGLTISGVAHMSLRAPSLSSITNDQVSGADVIFTCSYTV